MYRHAFLKYSAGSQARVLYWVQGGNHSLIRLY